ncbi:3-oxoadipate enol-lactonase [Lachnellula hyalina]|uniref:3-oxoadipate enol-lactonase n=1 Tax=Lachnellula hyalina TaxID=1316788 RepID=A0A8H8R5I0_9HELO|nr:3-oxoadipate enol-lactonase [Lachnellula hyalina]TVY28011.1 3-oxoadipate enol-lactonase [Lachnellula hyalina]
MARHLTATLYDTKSRRRRRHLQGRAGAGIALKRTEASDPCRSAEYIRNANNKSRANRPKVAEILAHTAYPDTIWKLTPTQSGQLPVASTRGGPIKIDWEVHGHGDIKLVVSEHLVLEQSRADGLWIMGLGSHKSSWQRQTLCFGHEEGDKYSSLIFDNRGMGKSDKPLMRYSTSEMAKDVLELVDHLGWTKERQLHITGVSMGGMIAQELGLLIPNRICTLNLISTAAFIKNTTTYLENLRTRIMMFVPKSLDRAVTDSAQLLFSPRWLDAPDTSPLPTSSTPLAILPPSGSYPRFTTNYERFAAQELTKRLDADGFPRRGFMMQAIAAGWHYKSPEQLGELGDRVGRERIAVVHGTEDRMISVPHGRKLIEWLGVEGVRGVVKEGVGHIFMLEEWEWHNVFLAGRFESGEALNEGVGNE